MANQNPGSGGAGGGSMVATATAAVDKWTLIRGLIADTVGPLALLAGAGSAFVKASAGAALNAARMQQALQASDGAAKLQKDFEHLMGSTAAAQKQVEMLAKVASSGAFTFDSLAQASKNLQVLTNGALNTEQALRKIQDSAAATGAPVDAMAASVSDLYNALNSGAVSGSKFAEGVGGAASQLQRMGAISAATVAQVTGLAESGASVSSTWQVVEADLARAAGAASELGGTIAGLKQQLATLEESGSIDVGNQFAEGEKAGLRAAIAFAKVSTAMESANAGPWAAVVGVINSVKEAVANLFLAVANTGPFTTFFKVVGVLGVGAFVALTAVMIVQGAAMISWAASTAVGGAAMTGLAVAIGAATAALKVWAASVTFASGGLTLIVAAFIAMGGAAITAGMQVSALAEELKKIKSKDIKVNADINSRIKSVKTVEDYDQAKKEIDDQKAGKVEQRKQGQKEMEELDASYNPFFRDSRRAAAQEKIDNADKGITVAQEQGGNLLEEASASGALSFDKQRLDIAKERLELEKQILEAARQSVQQSSSPKEAAKYAKEDREAKEKKFNDASATQENVAGDRRITENAAAEVAKKKDAEVADQQDIEAKKKKASELKSVTSYGDVFDEVTGGDESELKSIKDSIGNSRNEAKPGQVAARFDSSVYDQARDGYTKSDGTKVEGARTAEGKLDIEIAKRTALETEKAAASSELEQAQKDTSPLKDVLVERAQKRVDNVTGQIGGITDLDGKRVGEAGLAPAAMQGLQVDLASAKAEGSTVKSREDLENARKIEQLANEALAAHEAAIEASAKRLDLEQQISALSGGTDSGKQDAIDAEQTQSRQDTEKKRAPLAAKEKAREEYVKATRIEGADKVLAQGSEKDSPEQKQLRAKIEAAREAMESASTAAASQGVKDGDSQESYDLDNKAADAKKRQATQDLRENVASRKFSEGERAKDDDYNSSVAATRGSNIGSRIEANLSADKETNALLKRKAATEAVAAAEEKLKSAPEADKAKATSELNQVREQAKAAGFQDGDNVESINAEIASVQKVKEMRLQQAAIEEAAAQRRRDNAMQELRVMQQMAQINMDRALKKTPGKTEFDVRKENRDKELRDLDKAQPLVAQRDALEEAKAAGQGTPEGDKAINELTRKLKGLGIEESETSQDVNTKRNKNKTEDAADIARKTDDAEQIGRDMKIKMAETQMNYGQNPREAEARMKSLQDEKSVSDLSRQYEDKGIDPTKAKELATLETERARIQTTMDEVGTPKVDNLTAMGGGATGFVGVAVDEKSLLKELDKKADEQNKILEEINQQNKQQAQIANQFLQQQQ
jgi:hypothetical protein